MGERRKRQRLSEDGSAAIITNSEDQASSSNANPKDPGEESNASARRSLFVRSLPSTATTEALTELFSQNYPLKHAVVVIDPATKQSRGYGFVTFADAEDAQRAKDEFHGHIFQGRKIKVEIAEPRHRDIGIVKDIDGVRKIVSSAEATAARKARKNKISQARKPPKLIIRNLPWSIKDPDQLALLFRKFGKVKQATLPKAKNKDTQAGFGFVVMRGRKNAERALNEVNGSLVDGRTIAVDWAVEKEVWEEYNTAGEKEIGDGVGDDASDGGVDLKDNKGDESPVNTNDDVSNFMKNHFDELEDEDDEGETDEEDEGEDSEIDGEKEDRSEEYDVDMSDAEEGAKAEHIKSLTVDNSSTLFIRNLPFAMLDAGLKEHFIQFGPIRYARIVLDRTTERPKGTGFVCFFNVDDADKCFRGAPKQQLTGANAIKKGSSTSSIKRSILEDVRTDTSGRYTIDGRVLQVARAVDKSQAQALIDEGTKIRDVRDRDKRRLFLLSEGTVAAGTPLYDMLAPSEVKMREESAMQRKKLIQGNPSLHLSLTRLALRNIPKNITSKDLKALAREAVVGFAKDVKSGLRAHLSKEEETRGGEEMREAERQRKVKGKGVVKQAKVIFEGRNGSKVSETSGAGRSRGYGFIEYSSHRWALMGLRWLNGHAMENETGKKQRLIVEFAIENAQVVARRKEKEEKARTRSQEVMKARANGEMPDKGKELDRNIVIARIRKGMKASSKEGLHHTNGKLSRSTNKNDSKGNPRQQGIKRKRGGEDAAEKSNSQPSKVGEPKKPISGSPTGEEEKFARRIAKKRAMRRARKRGKST
jgi:nucleolar protein 4